MLISSYTFSGESQYTWVTFSTYVPGEVMFLVIIILFVSRNTRVWRSQHMFLVNLRGTIWDVGSIGVKCRMKPSFLWWKRKTLVKSGAYHGLFSKFNWLLSYFLGLWVRKVVLAENKYLNRSMKISTFSKCRFCSNDVIVWNLNIHYDPKISQCKSKFILASIARSKVTGTEKKHVSYKKLILKVKFKNSELHHSFYLRTI